MISRMDRLWEATLSATPAAPVGPSPTESPPTIPSPTESPPTANRNCWPRGVFSTWALLLGSLLGLLLMVVAGCSRAYYRRQADREVYGLVDGASGDPRWPLDGFTIQPHPESRMFDPFCPDLPPMPPDDPTSHQLMHCVDCKPGWPCWQCYGKTPWVDNPNWKACLPRDEQGQVVLDREAAVQMALLHSQTYQRELEDLYLSALDVSFERFRLDAQFFGGNSTFFTADGPLRSGVARSELLTDTDLQMRKLFATGGELVVGAANSIVWQFAGPDEFSDRTLLDFALVQPLLRASGRAVVLESLTGAERALLSNIRQMERFRRAFYTQTVAGRSTLLGPSRGGVGFDGVSTFTARSAGGFLRLLQQQVEIRNQRANVARLRESLERLVAFYESGRITAQQVGITRQSLYDTQSALLSITAAYENELDEYKITLGLPPDLVLNIEDRLLAQFDLIDPKLTDTQGALADFLEGLRDQLETDQLDPQGDNLSVLDSLRQDITVQLEAVERDFESLIEALPTRGKRLQQLSQREEFRRGDVDPGVVDFQELCLRAFRLCTQLKGVEAGQQQAQELVKLDDELEGQQAGRILAGRLVELSKQIAGFEAATELAGRLSVDPPERDLQEDLRGAEPPDSRGLAEQLEETLADVQQLQETMSPQETDGAAAAAAAAASQDRLIELVSRLSGQLLAMSLIQASSRLDTATLEPIEIDAEEAFRIARVNRRDWMNARAALVDVWRQVEVTADDLASDLDVTFSGDINTTDNNPVRFRGTTGRLRMGLAFDAPLTRLAERNVYRESLIDYQRARRQYYTLEDRIAESLRDTVRTIRLNQLNFEVQRASVFVAAARVDEAQERLAEPGGSKLQVNTARNLVEALRSLLRAQNDFLRIWVNQEALRMNLDLDLGTMELDDRGLWIDPGPIGTNETNEQNATEEAPLPEEIPHPDGEPLPAEAPLPLGASHKRMRFFG